jgi:hypothetical protein
VPEFRTLLCDRCPKTAQLLFVGEDPQICGGLNGGKKEGSIVIYTMLPFFEMFRLADCYFFFLRLNLSLP